MPLEKEPVVKNEGASQMAEAPGCGWVGKVSGERQQMGVWELPPANRLANDQTVVRIVYLSGRLLPPGFGIIKALLADVRIALQPGGERSLRTRQLVYQTQTTKKGTKIPNVGVGSLPR